MLMGPKIMGTYRFCANIHVRLSNEIDLGHYFMISGVELSVIVDFSSGMFHIHGKFDLF